MVREFKRYVLERGSRVKFIKTEMFRLVGASLKKNPNVTAYSRIGAYVNPAVGATTAKWPWQGSKSTFRLFCLTTLSPKLVNKKYRLSRFGFNKIAHKGRLPKIFRKGW